MSDLVPYGMTPEQQEEYIRTQQKLMSVMAPNAAASAITNLMPDPHLPGVAGYIPFTGAAENLAGFAGHVYNVLRSGANLAAGSEVLPAQWQWTKDAAQHADTTHQEILTSLPHYTPTAEEAKDPAWDNAAIVGSATGNMIPVAPGSGLTSLGKLGTIAKFMVPTTEGALTNLGIASGVGVGATALPKPAKAGDQPQPVIPDIDSLINPPAEKEQPVSNNPFPTTTSGPAASFDQIINSGAQFDLPAPTFGEQGESNLTVGQILGSLALTAGAIFAAKYFHGIGTTITAAARDARMNDPTYAQKATDYNNEQIAAGTGPNISQSATGGRAEAPLPGVGPVQDAASAAKASTLDANELMRQYIKLTSEDPVAARKLANKVGLTLNDASWQTRLRSFLTTGVDDQTSLHMPSPKRLFDDIAELSDVDKKRLNDGLMAGNELDNRTNNRRAGVSPAEYDYPNQSDQDLARLFVDAQSDPVIKEIMGRYQQISSRLISIGEARNFFSAQEARDIRAAHPWHVADVDETGRVLHAMGPRDATPGRGVEQVNTNAWSAMAQHIEALYRQYELNELRTALVDHQLDIQTRFPNSAQFISRRLPNAPQQPSLYPTVGAQAAGPREPTIAIRRGTGVEYYRVDNPMWRDVLSGNNATKMKTVFDAMSVPRRWLQTGTTGLASTLTGRIFPLTNMLRTTFQAPINRPKGFAGGLIDLGVQKATGGRIGYRGFDPTNLVGAAYSGARSGFDDLALQLHHMFDKSNPNRSTQLLTSILTPQRMDVMRDALLKYYTGTATAEMRAQGVSGMGVPFRTRLPAFSRTKGESPDTIRLVSGELSPKLFMSGGRLGTIRPHWINLKRAAEEAFASVSDSGHEYFYRLNRFKGDIDKDTLAYETRALVGDPGVAGAGKFATVVRSGVPYANVSAQGVSRFGRAFNETPVGTMVGLASSLGTVGLLSLYTAMQNDATRDYLQNIINTQGRAANVLVFGNANPALHTAFSLPQELRPFYAMTLDILSKALNIDAMRHDDDHHDGVLGFMKDWFSQHIENSTWQSALHGAADAANILDIPSSINAILAGSGSTARIDLGRIVGDIRDRQFGLKSFYMPTGTDSPLPNHPPGDNLLEGQDAHKFSVMMSNLFGMVGGMWDHVVGLDRYYAKTNDFWASLGQTGKDWIQSAMDANPSLNNILFENPVRESTRPAVVEKVSRELQAMKVTAGAMSAERMEGTTGGPRPLPVSPQVGEGRVPTDPTMRNMYFATSAEYNWINSRVMTDINALKKQMADQSQQMGDTRQRRELLNQQTRTLSDKYRYIQDRIDDLNAALSRQVHAPVDVMKIDWSKGPEQFHN